VRHGQFRTPVGLVQIKPVFPETRQVDDAGIRAPAFVVRGWLTKVVPSGPDKLTGDKRVSCDGTEHLVR